MRSRAFNPLALARDAVRNSPWIAMAVALHIICGAIAMVAIRQRDARTTIDEGITLRPPRPTPPIEETIAPFEPIVRNQIPDFTPAEIVDTPDWRPDEALALEPAEIAGDPTSTSDSPRDGGDLASSGIGVGVGGTRGTRPNAFPGRAPGRRPKGNGPGGPEQRTERAVLEGLRWLARHQNPDGSWGAAALRERCVGDDACASLHPSPTDHYDVGLTSVALLGFLGAGFGHAAPQTITDPVTGRKQRVGDIVKSGLRWLVARETPEGAFDRRPFLYNEALATMALCEAYGLTGNRAWKEPAQRAVNFLARAQRPSPLDDGPWGWRYAPRQEIEDQRRETGDTAAYRRELCDADTSVTAWAVMALKSARLAGLEAPDSAFAGALEFTRWTSTPDGLVGYLSPQTAGGVVSGVDDRFRYHPAGMSALGMCIRIFSAHDASDPFLERAAQRLVADLPAIGADRLSIDYYYWYYGSLALNQFDGPSSPRRDGRVWNAWNKAMVASLLALQDGTERSCRRGGWTVRDRWWYAGGPIYATAINVLTLEVYYRYENAFGGARAPRRGEASKDR